MFLVKGMHIAILTRCYVTVFALSITITHSHRSKSGNVLSSYSENAKISQANLSAEENLSVFQYNHLSVLSNASERQRLQFKERFYLVYMMSFQIKV